MVKNNLETIFIGYSVDDRPKFGRMFRKWAKRQGFEFEILGCSMYLYTNFGIFTVEEIDFKNQCELFIKVLKI